MAQEPHPKGMCELPDCQHFKEKGHSVNCDFYHPKLCIEEAKV